MSANVGGLETKVAECIHPVSLRWPCIKSWSTTVIPSDVEPAPVGNPCSLLVDDLGDSMVSPINEIPTDRTNTLRPVSIALSPPGNPRSRWRFLGILPVPRAGGGGGGGSERPRCRAGEEKPPATRIHGQRTPMAHADDYF